MLRGKALYVPECQVRKHVYADSATKLSWRHASFYTKLYRIVDGCGRLHGYLWDAPVPSTEKCKASGLILLWSFYESLMWFYLFIHQQFPQVARLTIWQKLWLPIKRWTFERLTNRKKS